MFGKRNQKSDIIVSMSMFNFNSDVPSNPFEENKFDEYSNVSDEDYTKVEEPDFGEDA